MTWYEIILAFIAGLGSFKLIDFLTIASKRKQAKAEADKITAEAKKLNAEAENIEVEKDKKIVELWESYSRERAEQDKKVIAQLNKKIKELEDLFRRLNAKMEKQSDELEKYIEALKKANDCPGVENCVALKEFDKINRNEKSE